MNLSLNQIRNRTTRLRFKIDKIDCWQKIPRKSQADDEEKDEDLDGDSEIYIQLKLGF